MNIFKILCGNESAFEKIWRERDSDLNKVDGFFEFNLLKGPSDGATTLYASQTKWKSRTDFEMWTRSEAFRQANEGAEDRQNLYDEQPIFEGFEALLNQ